MHTIYIKEIYIHYKLLFSSIRRKAPFLLHITNIYEVGCWGDVIVIVKVL